jgi:peptide-methionine (S)-S-oxide reductase
MKQEIATFAAGCFWGVEETFLQTPGVLSTRVGYTGGSAKDPRYEEVCSDTSGHAEAVEVTFDPEKVSYKKLLDIFWNNHNPTTKNRQGPDFGSQYRSGVFFHSPEQKTIAEKSKDAFDRSGRYSTPAVTEITEATTFYPAEEYHQKYLRKSGKSSCHI